MTPLFPKLAAAAGLLALAAASAAGAQSSSAGFTQAQAQTGAGLYLNNCEMCHGPNLDDGQFAPSLKGANFKTKWGGKSAAELFDYVTASMPPGQPGTLAPDGYAAVLAHILKGNGVAPGDKPLPDKSDALKALTIPH